MQEDPLSAPAGRFGKYELLDRIAAGGMAEIFRARYSPAPGVTKQVCIKKILPHYAANRAFHSMFTNEARIAMGLSHGNIAQVFDFGDIDGDFFIAMELVDGPPLSKVIKRAKAMGISAIPVEFAVFIVRELLKGLHYAHTRLDEAGRPLTIVHRDVSPQNVLLSYEGQVKIVDFGIARARNAGREEASSGVKGKYVYFAPEQARAKEVDGRTDVFACGVVLYECLVGQLPFQGTMLEVLSSIVKGAFPAPRSVNGEVPPELEAVVVKAMALDKADRYQTAEAFEQDLSLYLASAHPEFTHAQLALFLQLLFEEELVKDGRPVRLPPEFIERSKKWRVPGFVEGPTEAIVMFAEEPETPPPPKAVERQLRAERGQTPFPLARAGFLALAAALVGFAGVWVGNQITKASLELASTPPGATVEVDGRRLPSPTPTRLTGLSGGRSYRVNLELPGYEQWSHDVPLRPGQHLLIDAALQRRSLPPSPPSPGAGPPQESSRPGTTGVAPTPLQVDAWPPRSDVEPQRPKQVGAVSPDAGPPSFPPDEQVWPTSSFELEADRHHLELSTAGATSVSLDPSRTYRVWLGKGPAHGYGYWIVNPAGVQLGTFGANPLQVRGATHLLAFYAAPMNPGIDRDVAVPRNVFVLDVNKKRPITAVVKPLTIPAGSTVVVSGLAPSTSYEISARPGRPPVMRVGAARAVTKMAILHPTEGLLLLAIEGSTRVSGATQLALTLLQDGTTAYRGRVQVDIREVPAKAP